MTCINSVSTRQRRPYIRSAFGLILSFFWLAKCFGHWLEMCSISSLRDWFLSITHTNKKECREHRSLSAKSLSVLMKNENKNDKKKLYYLRFLLCTVNTIDSHFVPITTLRRDDSGIEPCQVRIPTSSDKVRIPTLSKTVLELAQFLLCAEYVEDICFFR